MTTNTQITENFSYKELSCKGADASCGGCNSLPITDLLYYHMDKLQSLRTTLGAPLRITSGHRCERHNRSVGGAPNSMHLHIATDVQPFGENEEVLQDVEKIASEMTFRGIGVYNSFVHLDSRAFIGRELARWNNQT